jgi:hypothetical protein
VKWAQFPPFSDRGFCDACLSERTRNIKLHEGVDFGLKKFDPRKVRFDKLDWRDLAFANQLCHLHSWQKN